MILALSISHVEPNLKLLQVEKTRRKGPATPAFSGDWRGGAAGQQAPNPNGRAPAPVVPRAAVENESDEEAQAGSQPDY